MTREWLATQFKNDPPKSPFAPTWDYTIAEKQIDIDIELLKNIVLEKEIEIVQQYPANSDGGTGLGSKSLTSRFKYFNLLEWDYEVVKDLHQEIKKFHSQYTKSLFGFNYTHPTLYIRCWANVMRKNQKINKHFHSIHPHTYIGGHLSVQCCDTSTVYVNPYDDKNLYYSENKPGKLTLFPNYIPHYTTKHTIEEPRITIAFDITPLSRIFVDDKVDLLQL